MKPINYKKLTKSIEGLDPEKMCRRGKLVDDEWNLSLTVSLAGELPYNKAVVILERSIWGRILPEKFGGDYEFYSELSDSYEAEGIGVLPVKPGIRKALKWLKQHEKEAVN